MRKSVIAALLFSLIAVPLHAASIWDSASFGVGAQGAWFDGGGEDQSSMHDIEATGRAAFSITPHISVIGGAAYGFSESYLRSSVGFRLTATDVNDRNFSVGVGVSRHFRSEPGPLDEWCGEAGIGWKPLASSDIILTTSASYGLESERRLFTLGAVFPLKVTLGSR